MQAGEVIWLFAGIGIGLTAAMLILAAVLVVDGQRLRRRVAQGAAPAAAAFTPAPRAPAVSETLRRPAAEARPKPVPVAPPPPPKVLEPIVADPKVVAPAAVVVDEMMTDLAAEIARMQTTEPVTVAAELPPPVEPVRVVAEPAVPEPPPAPEPVAAPAPESVTPPPAPPVPEPAAAPIAEAPVAAPPPAPKVPPLPKVTPARKFAPALPPRDPKT